MDRRALKSPSRSVFGVSEVAASTSGLASNRIHPTGAAFLCITSICCCSGWILIILSYRGGKVIRRLSHLGLETYLASVILRIGQGMVSVIFIGAITALCKAISSQEPSYDGKIKATPIASVTAGRTAASSPLLSTRQPQNEILTAMTPTKVPKKAESPFTKGTRQISPRVLSNVPVTSTGPLVPSHPSGSKTVRAGDVTSSWVGLERYRGLDSSSNAVLAVSHTPASGASPIYLNQELSPFRSQASPGETFSSPWDKEKTSLVSAEVRSESELEEFLAKIDTKLVESAGKTALALQANLSSPTTIQGVKGESPGSVSTPGLRYSTLPSAAVRNFRISPGRQKSGVSPKKGEGDLPLPMTMEQAIDGFCRLGIYPQIEQWRDSLRQWFSQVLLNPLVRKIETSHSQVMAAAAKLGITIHITPLGGSNQDVVAPATSDGSTLEWLTTFSPDEDALMHQFRAALINFRDATSNPQQSVFGVKVPQQGDNIHTALLQDCLDAVTEHQRLKALMKGEWVKGLLPQSSVRSDYTVQRIKELAEGTCLKRFEFVGCGEMYDTTKKKWTLELPTDSHLLVYLFCALLEHPHWMLHVDPTAHPGTQSGNNPLFVVCMPPKERFPEKYVAVLSGAPPTLHNGACVLAVDKQSPPVFALYWDKRLQFALQGRTSLWDSILLLCHHIKVSHGGIVRGINLGSSAFNLLSVIETSSLDDAFG
ncbi:hypothetical protein O6H91_17G015200 [Diphasiastrum complanatum]|uniref:Uncharacterized protein n=1 Tax=Diphasiastrum complanatum TaxID=34168 RepID=A0ACC2B4F8_DIPCM|nr:hypothetical protein O6H91_17G015200 [Diphasiastrum complanatum]